MTTPSATSVAVKRSLKLVTIITNRALNISDKAMLPSSDRHLGLTKTMEKNVFKLLGNRNANHPLPARGKGLHDVPHREVCNSLIMLHYMVEQDNRSNGKMPPY